MATDYKAKFQKARGARKVDPRGRVVIEAQSIDHAAGTITGKIIDGIGVGEIVTFVPGGKLTLEDYTKKAKTKLDLPGGLLRVENIERARASTTEAFKGSAKSDPWTKTLIAHPSKAEEKILTGQVMKAVHITYKDTTKPDLLNINIMDVKNEKFSTDIDGFRAAVREAYASTGAFTMMAVSPDNEPIDLFYYRKSEKKEDGYGFKNTLDEDVDLFFTNLGTDGVEALKEILAHKGISVVPTNSVRVGTDTWMEVKSKEAEKGDRRNSGANIELVDFQVASLGGRFARAVAALESEDDRKRVRDAFLAQANDDQKVAFGKGGFAAIGNTAMQAFLEARGATIINAPEDGYTSGSVITRPYDLEKKDGNYMVVKTFPVYAPTPFPAVEAYKDLRAAYYAEMDLAVKAVLEGPAKTVEAAAPEVSKAEVKAEAAAEAQAPVETAAPVSQEEADIDSLLDEIDGGRL